MNGKVYDDEQSIPLSNSCKNDEIWDKRTKPDKTGQNLKEKEKVKEKEKEKEFLGGRAACPIDGTKTVVEMDKTGTKPPDKFCPTVGQNLYNDFCPNERDKTPRQNWDKNGQNLLEEFCPSMGQNPCHDICPDELDKTSKQKMDKTGQNPTISFDHINGTKPPTEFCPMVISRSEAVEMVANSEENLYILGNKVLCEDDDREWIII